MTRKILAKGSPGTSTAFGADDIDYINLLLTGTDQTSTDPVDINTQWTYRSSKLRISNTANTFYYIIAGSAITANRTLTLPLLTAGDTAVTENTAQPLSNKVISAASNTLPSIIRTPDIIVAGFTTGTATAGGYGIYAGNISQSGGSVNTTTTDGKYIRYTSGTTAGNDAGLRVNTATAAVIRGKNCHFKARFRFAPTGTATSARLFVGLVNSNAFLTGDDPLNAITGIGVSVVTTDSNFRIARNDSSGATVFSAIGAGTAVDSNIHTIEIQADQANTGFKYSWDGGAYTSLLTTDIPGQDDTLMAQIWTETNESAAKAVDVWYMIGDQDP